MDLDYIVIPALIVMTPSAPLCDVEAAEDGFRGVDAADLYHPD
jgi:hypothetical protein